MLVVGDDLIEAEGVAGHLDPTEFLVSHVRTFAESLALTDHEAVDAVLLDLGSIAGEQRRVLRASLAHFRDAAIVVLSDEDDDPELAREALLNGAQDHLDRARLDPRDMARTVHHSVARLGAQRQIREDAISLTRANTELNDFAHILAHDLRAPIRTSRLLADRLVATVDDADPAVVDLGARLKATMGKLDSLILAMLDYTAARSDLPVPASVAIRPTAERSIDRLLARYGLAETVAVLSVAESEAVWASEELLGTVFDHLLVNAVEFHPAPADARIALSAIAEGDRVRITVTDNGHGVPSRARERVFQPMERLVSDPPGTGFGLAICRRIINGYGGSIWIQPEVTAGTTVVIELPRADET